jgi:hypothetical protein
MPLTSARTAGPSPETGLSLQFQCIAGISYRGNGSQYLSSPDESPQKSSNSAVLGGVTDARIGVKANYNRYLATHLLNYIPNGAVFVHADYKRLIILK